MTGLELLKAPGTTAGEIADIISEHCPPVCPAECDRLTCRECWLSWLTTGEPPKAAGPSDKQTAPDEEGLHPNLVEMYERHFRMEKRVQQETGAILHSLRAQSSREHYTLNGEPKTVEPFRRLVSADEVKIYVYFDDTVTGTVGDVQLVDTDGDVVAASDRIFEKPPSKGLYVAFKYKILEKEMEVQIK